MKISNLRLLNYITLLCICKVYFRSFDTFCAKSKLLRTAYMLFCLLCTVLRLNFEKRAYSTNIFPPLADTFSFVQLHLSLYSVQNSCFLLILAYFQGAYLCKNARLKYKSCIILPFKAKYPLFSYAFAIFPAFLPFKAKFDKVFPKRTPLFTAQGQKRAFNFNLLVRTPKSLLPLEKAMLFSTSLPLIREAERLPYGLCLEHHFVEGRSYLPSASYLQSSQKNAIILL